MKRLSTPKPLLVSFKRSVGDLRLQGLVAWGGRCLEVVAQSGARQVVLVDPDFSVFLGQPEELEERLRLWAGEQGVVVTRLSTKLPSRRAA
jgi:hypothetical protein